MDGLKLFADIIVVNDHEVVLYCRVPCAMKCLKWQVFLCCPFTCIAFKMPLPSSGSPMVWLWWQYHKLSWGCFSRFHVVPCPPNCTVQSQSKGKIFHAPYKKWWYLSVRKTWHDNHFSSALAFGVSRISLFPHKWPGTCTNQNWVTKV